MIRESRDEGATATMDDESPCYAAAAPALHLPQETTGLAHVGMCSNAAAPVQQNAVSSKSQWAMLLVYDACSAHGREKCTGVRSLGFAWLKG